MALEFSKVGFVFVAALSLATLNGCKSFGVWATGDNPNPTYGSDAETNLKAGKEALESKNFTEAEKYFDYVRSKYPYIEAATIAELLLADTDFERDRYLEARDRYQNFIKLHPTHPKRAYAAYRAAYSRYKDMPSNLFILPPAEEKDQAEVKGALIALREFVREYPQTEFTAEAQKELNDVRGKLAGHELYAAKFYAKREKWAGTVSRLEFAIREYGGSDLDEEMYFRLYDAYLALKDTAKAQETLRSYVAKAPAKSPGVERAQKLLKDSK